MNTVTVYNPAFVAQVAAVLAAKTAAGPVPRHVLCEAFGFAKEKAGLFSDLLQDGLLPDYESVLGKHGGIGRKGVVRPAGQTNRLDPAFVTLVNSTLTDMIPPGSTRIVTRGDVARAMGIPCGDTEQKISRALADKLVPGFDSRRGSGIFRDPSYVAPAPEEGMTSDGEGAASQESQAATAETTTAEESSPAKRTGPKAKPATKRNRK